MPLPFLVIPLAVAGGSAVAQAVAKLKSHARLNALRAEMEELESGHRDGMRWQYERQIELCLELELPEPELPVVLQETEQVEVEDQPQPRWRRLLRRRHHTLADGSPHSRTGIIGRHGASFAAGAIWRLWSVSIMNVLRPITAFLPRIASFLPRFAALGGTGGSIAASTGLRFALGAFNIFGIILGPVLAAWSIFQEVRSVRRARRELEDTRVERHEELYRYTARTRQLERQLVSPTAPVDVVSS